MVHTDAASRPAAVIPADGFAQFHRYLRLRVIGSLVACATPLGLLVSSTDSSFIPGGTVFTPCLDPDFECPVPIYTPSRFIPGSSTLGREAPMRVLLVGAILALVVLIVRTTATSVRAGRLGCVFVAAAAVLAVSQRLTAVVLLLVCALALLLPLWHPWWEAARGTLRTGAR